MDGPATARPRRPLLRLLRDPRVGTTLLTAALVTVGALLGLRLPASSLLSLPAGTSTVPVVVGLGLAFFLTELGQALVEVRRQAYSFSLAGVPLLLGLLFCPPGWLVAARLAAAVVAFTVQRVARTKFAFNTASYLVDVTLTVTLAHELAGSADGLSLSTAAWCYVSIALVDALMSVVVLLVIRINQGPLDLADAVGVMVPASVFVVLNSAAALVFAVLSEAGRLGAVLLVFVVATVAVVYRGYLVLRRRHHSLQLVHDFVALSTGPGREQSPARDLSVELLQHIRSVLRAGSVELVHVDAQGHRSALTVSEDGSTSRPDGRRTTDAFLAAVIEGRRAELVGVQTRDPSARAWLADRGVRDALLVPLSSSEGGLLVVVTDRMGDATTFTRDDLALLQTLGGHLAVALHSAHLVGRLRHDATHDVLTGLPNRALLTDRVHAALQAADEARPAVLLMDLNRFKEVNDALGHHVGDELLQVVAARMSAQPLPGATVARLGGDEFAVLLPSSPDAEADARRAARLLVEALASPVDLREATVATGASVGIAIARAGSTAADLLRHADTAMYAAKAAGEAVAVYDEALDRGRAERLALLADLHRALSTEELVLHYQPKLDLAAGVVTSVEALVRWDHPRLGRLMPDAFVPLAESTGLIEPFTLQVLRLALRQCRAWLDDGLELSVAVNLSARNVSNPDLPENVETALRDAGVPAHRLILEITESSVMGDPEHTVPILHRLAATGVTLSLDDFGTGYSSLSYLQRLPVQELKIDRSFVVGLTADGTDPSTSAALIRSITGLKEALGLRVVAEGVEDAVTLERLRELGCDLVQGYHLSRPVAAADLDTGRCRRSATGTRYGRIPASR